MHANNTFVLLVDPQRHHIPPYAPAELVVREDIPDNVYRKMLSFDSVPNSTWVL